MAPLPFNKLAGFMRAGGGVAGNPLRFASALNIRAISTSNTTSTRLKMWVRHKVIIGSDNFSSLRVMFPANYFALASGDTALGNDYTIEKCALEKETGGAATTPIYFSGSRSRVISNNTYDQLSDSILPSAFSLGTFTRGHVYWVRALLSVSTAGHKFPADGEPNNHHTNNTAFIHDPAAYILPDTDATGVFSFSSTGSGDSGFSFASQPALITVGTPVGTSGKYICGIGDSILFGFNTTEVGTAHGFFEKSLFDADLVSNPRAGIKIGISSSAANLWWDYTNTATKDILKYGNVTVDEYGVNNPLYTQSSQIWALAKGLGHYVIKTKLMTRTSSTDSYATVANQTVFDATYVTPTGSRPVFSAACAAQEGILFDKFVSFDAAVLDGANRDKWQAPGYTTDGLHLTNLSDSAIAAVMRTTYAAIP